MHSNFPFFVFEKGGLRKKRVSKTAFIFFWPLIWKLYLLNSSNSLTHVVWNPLEQGGMRLGMSGREFRFWLDPYKQDVILSYKYSTAVRVITSTVQTKLNRTKPTYWY